MMRRLESRAAIAAVVVCLAACSPTAQQAAPVEKTGVLSLREYKSRLDEKATGLSVDLCDDLVNTGCMPATRFDCRQLLARELASCTEFTRSEVGSSVSPAQQTRWDAYFSDCAYETVRSLVDMEREECRQALH